MSVEEIKERIKSLTPAERREVELSLRELDAAESAVPTAVPRMSFEEAKAYLFRNCDRLLRNLA